MCQGSWSLFWFLFVQWLAAIYAFPTFQFFNRWQWTFSLIGAIYVEPFETKITLDPRLPLFISFLTLHANVLFIIVTAVRFFWNGCWKYYLTCLLLYNFLFTWNILILQNSSWFFMWLFWLSYWFLSLHRPLHFWESFPFVFDVYFVFSFLTFCFLYYF